jgi:N-acyl-D-amino-acid deacylase
MALDLLIRNATIVDGSGGPRYRADVGVHAGTITEIGRILTPAKEIIDADGLVLSPGFIDGHTHMDAQVNWDPLGSCSCWHGVTSVVMGNCGFALAPCPESDREWFAKCLEAVEDIPVAAMMAGIDWNWETFPEYLATVERLPKGINYGAYLGHSALRMYTMGERALSEKATSTDLEKMGNSVLEALKSGALGFSSSHATTHVTPDGSPVASRIGDWDELEFLIGQMAKVNAGIFQIGPDLSSGEAHRTFLERLQKVAVQSGRPIMFGALSTRQGVNPNSWQFQTNYLDEAAAAGGRIYGQVTTRSINAIFSLKSYLPFDVLPGWQRFRNLPIEEQKRYMADPANRRALIAEEAGMKPRDDVMQGGGAATTDPRKPDYDNLYAMRDVRWDDPTVAELAQARNQHPVEVIMDLATENENQVFVQPLVNESPDDVFGLLNHPRTLATFSDSGAHVCQEMGSSLQTHLLSYWVRDREAFTLEEAVRMLTFDNASAWELPDRGLVRTGYKADLLLFDEKTIRPQLPTVESDLPGGSRRLVQKADGIAMTIVNGNVSMRDGESTGQFSGEVLKGPLATRTS